jgi:antitoxin component YwqK of YwqJK toxin-antitoxin module
MIKIALAALMVIGMTACTNMDEFVKKVSWEKELKRNTSNNLKFDEVEIVILNQENGASEMETAITDVEDSEEFIADLPTIKPKVIKDISEENGAVTEITPRVEKKGNVREYTIDRMAQGKDKKIYLDNENTPYTGDFIIEVGGKVEYRESYVDGVLNGDKVWYGENGKIGLIEPYKNGKRMGTQISYYTNGTIRSKINYKDNRLDGTIEWFDKNGKLINSSKIINGNGNWLVYSHNGRLREKGNYKNWKKDGAWIKYFEDGSLEKKETYKDGKLVKREWY